MSLDNANRAKRVSQLATDIAQLQAVVKERIDDAQMIDAEGLEVLDEISKKQGYKTLDEYLAAAEEQLTVKDREMYLSMQKEFEKTSADLDVAMKSALGMA